MIINLFQKSLLILFFVFCASFVAAQEYMIGADLSFAKEAEEKGFTFKEDDKDLSKKVCKMYKEYISQATDDMLEQTDRFID